MNVNVNPKKLNPNGFQLLRYVNDTTIRFIILFGGSSSAKSFSVAQIILLSTIADGENTLVMRKVGASIEKSIYEDFKVAARLFGISELFKFQQNKARCLINNARIDFAGLDDPEKIKGISNYKRVCLEELSEFDSADFKQIRKRLRGKVGQQIIGTFNPISETHWVKKELFDVEQWHDVDMSMPGVPPELTKVKSLRMNAPRTILNARTHELEEHPSDFVVIQSTYLNNFWVVGSPDGTYGFYDDQCVSDFERDRINDPDYYNVYALGEWGVIRTGSEFLGSFNRGRHCMPLEYDDSLPIHLSVDSNVLPYISVGFWQIAIDGENKQVRQIGEVAAGNPNNTVRKAAKVVADRLHELGYEGKLYVHADASTKSSNNIDDEKRSFIDLFMTVLKNNGFEVVDKVGKKNPSVSMSGEFMNAIFDGVMPNLQIAINDKCSVSIEDYMAVQKDVNGGILKARVKNKQTQQSYEEHGHFTDTARYIITDLLRNEFIEYSNRRKYNIYAKGGFITFFNPDADNKYTKSLMYCIPNIDGKFVSVTASLCGDKWHLQNVCYRDTSTDDVKDTVTESRADVIYIEAPETYFSVVREIREHCNHDIRVMKELSDIDRRIQATSDYARNNIIFKRTDDEEYTQFLDSLLDYNKDSQDKTASSCLSGFAVQAIKLVSN